MSGISIKTSDTRKVIDKAIEQALSLVAYESMPQFEFHAIVQGDQGSIELCRKLLSDSDNAEKKRFIFIPTNTADAPFSFWEKTLTNLGLGASFDLSKDNIYSVFSKLNSSPNVNVISKVLNGILKLNRRFKKEKAFEHKYIDEIDNPSHILHGNGKDTPANRRRLLFYAFLRKALEDWSKQNEWVLKGNGKLSFIIIDDIMAEDNWPKTKREKVFCLKLKRTTDFLREIGINEWHFYRLVCTDKFLQDVKGALGGNLFKCKKLFDSGEAEQKYLSDFTHILIDWQLDDSDKYSGWHLLKGLKSFINKNTEKLNVIPELLILSRNPDPVTIQSALEAGASGYVIKDNIAELPYVVGRAGRPLKSHQNEEMDSLISDNFPSLKSFPAFVPKALYFDQWKRIKDFDPPHAIGNDYENETTIGRHRKWLQEIPKADQHVHFGTAIPLDVCYDLALISVYRWACQYCGAASSGNDKRWEQLVNAAKLIEQILNKAADGKKGKEEHRDLYLDAFKKITRIYEISTVNNTVKRLNRRFDKLSEELIACLIVVGMGFQHGVYKLAILEERIDEINEICDCIESVEAKEVKQPLLSFYLQDATKIIEGLKDQYKQVSAEDIISIAEFLIKPHEIGKENNPLSDLLSIPVALQKKPQGLPKYLGGGDLAGASLLQFTETLLLASYHIPKWAAEQNVWHQELRAGSNGFLKGFTNPTIPTKIMMLGLYAGIKAVKAAEDKHLTTSVLITAKRHKDKKDIKEAVQLATEFVTKNEKDLEEGDSKEFIPKVLGMDLAGAERGNLPEDLVESFKESFKGCLMMTVHAGEDESVESVWQAVYSLHALRVGHGLKLEDHSDLKRLFKDRQLCVELCPKSNQFTNGYAFKNHENPKNSCYVLKDYMDYGIPLTVNTDNPLISHIANGYKMDYPLSEEYLSLSSLVCTNPEKCGKPYRGCKTSNPLLINRLLILKLIYNGFKYSFLSPKEKAQLIEYADRKVFNALAEEFLDVYISAER